MEDENLSGDIFGLNIEDEIQDTSTRKICKECERPERVCLCEYIPNPRIRTRIKIMLLQHPNEEKRQIRTGRLLELGLAADSCQVYKCRKFPGNDKELKQILESQSTALLYPGAEARELTYSSEPDENIENLLILDGTWDQAKKIYQRNPSLHKIKQIKLSLSETSQYVVRTQPSVHGLSTIEIATHALAILENKKEIVAPLLKPLQALCKIQLDYGEVNHHSKDIKNKLKETESEKL